MYATRSFVVFALLFVFVALTHCKERHYTLIIQNNCKYNVTPSFTPDLVNAKKIAVTAAGSWTKYKFKTNDYRGKVSVSQVDTTTSQTYAEIDLKTGKYDLVSPKDANFQHALTVSFVKKEKASVPSGYCVPAGCQFQGCLNAYPQPSGLLDGNRPGNDTVFPNHACPIGKFKEIKIETC